MNKQLEKITAETIIELKDSKHFPVDMDYLIKRIFTAGARSHRDATRVKPEKLATQDGTFSFTNGNKQKEKSRLFFKSLKK